MPCLWSCFRGYDGKGRAVGEARVGRAEVMFGVFCGKGCALTFWG
jgi:hypothetical protein